MPESLRAAQIHDFHPPAERSECLAAADEVRGLAI